VVSKPLDGKQGKGVNQRLLGISIDEDTALIWRGSSFNVIGSPSDSVDCD
jgi:hypothetical protein